MVILVRIAYCVLRICHFLDNSQYELRDMSSTIRLKSDFFLICTL